MPFKPCKQRQKALAANKLTYNTGKPCKRGHFFDRYTLGACCIQCVKENGIKNAKKYRARSRNWELKKNYGITQKEYDNLSKKQKKKCAICRNPEKTLSNFKTKKVLAVDHCHKSKRIRGLLCFNYNVGLGKFKHNSSLLREAALYCEAI